MKRTTVRTAALMVAVIAAAMLPDSSAPEAADVSAKLKAKSTNPIPDGQAGRMTTKPQSDTVR